jgi:hypothetical protein
VQGVIGVQGATGAPGAQGVQGVIGVQGAVGAPGAQGVQGVIGVQGAVGAPGAQGVQGAVGAQGAQGVIGVEGAVGAQGAQGVQGAVGAQGTQGRDGNFGGSSFYYKWENDTSNGFIANGFIELTNTNPIFAEFVAVSPLDRNDKDLTSFLQTIDDSTSAIKGSVKITEEANTTNFVIYNITGTHTTVSGHYDVPVAYVTGTYVPPAQNTFIVASFLVNGDKGDIGPQGVQGAIGAQGVQGVVGAQGIQGVQGLVGAQGVQGLVGAQGDQGI